MKKIRLGMVGGGPGAFIGDVHRMASMLDGEFELVAGCFSRTPEKSKQKGEELDLSKDRVYSNYTEMAQNESKLPENESIQAVSIVTPNNSHYPIAKTFLENGFHVICDKPLTSRLEDAQKLYEVYKKSGKIFALTHNYTGYPMVKEARVRIAGGEIGKVRKVFVEYLQGWLSEEIEKEGQKQASWRVDPAQAGISCCMGDIGTHCENLVSYMTGMQIKEVLSDLHIHGKDRVIDDDGAVFIRLDDDVTGTLMASQVCTGEENSLIIRIYGTKGYIKWRQEDSNYLELFKSGEGKLVLKTANDYNSGVSNSFTRLPAGHPEGFIEGFANIYKEAARAIREESDAGCDFPKIEDGIRGMKFLGAVVESSKKGNMWVTVY